MSKLTPEEATEQVRAGKVIRLQVGTDPEDPVCMVRLGHAYDEPHVLTTSISGWSEGYTEPVCEAESDFITSFFADAESLSLVPNGREIHGLPESYW